MAERALGRPIAEQRVWAVGALHALLRSEASIRAFQRCEGAMKMLPLLLCPFAPVKRAVAALLARCCQSSNSVCLSLLRGGAPASWQWQHVAVANKLLVEAAV